MDRATSDMLVVVTPYVAVAALLFVAVIWRPRALRLAIERHSVGIDRGYRSLMVALATTFRLHGDGWAAAPFLLFALVGTSRGRRWPI